MRNLEDIEKDLAVAREALLAAEGTPAEVYSRIVGYYRSVRNWNRGKREEYGERQLYRVNELRAAVSPRPAPTKESLLLLFIRASCPACPPAKAAAGKLGIPVELVNADTAEGMAEAVRRNVMSTPTAILISSGGEELARAGNAETIGRLLAAASR
jgi:ribonucleoside-triphosphate reductase